VRQVRENLDDIQDRTKLYQTHESIFDCPVTEYPSLDDAVEQFVPYEKLWTNASDLHKVEPDWMDGRYGASCFSPSPDSHDHLHCTLTCWI
jgi:hypothetical protein